MPNRELSIAWSALMKMMNEMMAEAPSSLLKNGLAGSKFRRAVVILRRGMNAGHAVRSKHGVRTAQR
jgi:hypothetical protein